MKYYNTEITFREVPDEISLCINISDCPNQCPDCHSKFLWEDTGIELDEKRIDQLIKENPGITCIAFMGGDKYPIAVREFALYVKETYGLKTCWYSGRLQFSIPNWIYKNCYDYVKFGPYIKEFGGLDNPNTNQVFYKWNKELNIWEDITSCFQKTNEK